MVLWPIRARVLFELFYKINYKKAESLRYNSFDILATIWLSNFENFENYTKFSAEHKSRLFVSFNGENLPNGSFLKMSNIILNVSRSYICVNK